MSWLPALCDFRAYLANKAWKMFEDIVSRWPSQ